MIEAREGGLALVGPDGTVLSGLALRLRVGDRVVTGPLVAVDAPAVRAHDGAGEYQSARWRLAADGVTAELELRRYASPQVVVGVLHYEGPALAAERAVEVALVPDAFARGLALKRIKLFWLAPAFVSDHRLLSPSNVLLLWQREGSGEYQVLVPLAGDGMIGEVGHEGYQLRVALESRVAGLTPRAVPLFAVAMGRDPYRLPADAYRAGFAAAGAWGRMRDEKPLPEVFKWLGWCSWNTYYQEVTEEKVLASARSLRERRIPVGFMLVDDGWMTLRGRKLADYEADPVKFPGGLAGLARVLRGDLGVRHLGVWHAFQGHWEGVDPESEIAGSHAMLRGLGGQALPDPRQGAGRAFYDDWYRRLRAAGYEMVKVDNQAANSKFTDGTMTLWESGGGTQKNVQEAAAAAGLEVLACMAMSLEGAFHWRTTAVARNSDDYIPDVRRTTREHVLQNGYNALWTACFAWPDWDMFQTHDRDALVHAIARALSGGPIYFSDTPGVEQAELLRALCDRAGRTYRVDQPGMVTRDLLLVDPSMGAGALKIWGRVRRPGYEAGAVGAFHVDKAAAKVRGQLRSSDVDGFPAGARAAVWRHVAQSASALEPGDAINFIIEEPGAELFTLVPIDDGVAVLGLLDKLLGPAAVTAMGRPDGDIEVRLSEGGELGLWLERPVAAVEIDGETVAPEHVRQDGALVRIAAAAFGDAAGDRRVTVLFD